MYAFFRKVSRGAEIILLSKKLFMKYADDNTRHLVKEHVKRYPGESTMQMNLQSEVDWDLYKDKIIQGFLKMKSHEKTLLPTVWNTEYADMTDTIDIWSSLSLILLCLL